MIRSRLGVRAAISATVSRRLKALRPHRVPANGNISFPSILGARVPDPAWPGGGRAVRPDRAEAGRGEEGDQGLGAVGEIGDDAVALRHAEGPQPLPDLADPLAQLAPAKLGEGAELRRMMDRDL